MSETNPNAFIGRQTPPADADLARALGPTKPLWDRFVSEVAAQCGADVQEWRCYSAKSGWALRLRRAKRTIVWLAPCESCFQVAFILGDKAVKAARESNLPARVLRLLDTARKYPEGTGLRMEIRRQTEIPALLKLAGIKLRN